MTTNNSTNNVASALKPASKLSPRARPAALAARAPMVSVESSRKAPVTHKDLMITYLIEGPDALNPMLTDHTDPVGVLERMIGGLQSKNLDAGDLIILRDHFAEIRQVGSPGRKSPETGDTRVYTVQQPGEDGDLFVRIPLGTLDVKRGEKVLAEFGETGILIRKG